MHLVVVNPIQNSTKQYLPESSHRAVGQLLLWQREFDILARLGQDSHCRVENIYSPSGKLYKVVVPDTQKYPTMVQF